jgi:hypothetical protein
MKCRFTKQFTNQLMAQPKKAALLALVGLLLVLTVDATAADAHKMQQIDTCYHWLDDSQMAYKLRHAEAHGGEFYYGGSRPMYCWRSPLGAYSSWEAHGDQLIRVKFKPGVTVAHRSRIEDYTSMSGVAAVIYSNDNQWHEYTVAPDAIESWSVYHPTLVAEMSSELLFYNAGLATANDVFYPFTSFNLAYLNSVIPPIIGAHTSLMKAGNTKIYGTHQERHFVTGYVLPWQKFLKAGSNKVIQLPFIKVRRASFGLNLDAQYLGNSTQQAGAFCDNKLKCTYKVNSRFLKLDIEPDKEKSFDIEWTCGANPKKFSHREVAPAEGKIFEIECPYEP